MTSGTSGGDLPGRAVAPALVRAGASGPPVAYLDRLVTIVGSKPNCHLRLADGRVSGAHALLVTVGSRTHLRDLVSRTGIFVRGRRVQEAFLKDGDPIRIGDAEFEFRLVDARRLGEAGPRHPEGSNPVEAKAAESKEAAPLELVVEGFDDAPPVPVEGPVFLIGRRPGAEVILEDTRVSSAHAAIIEALGVWHVYDLNSKYGTFVNQVRTQDAVLSEGDLIQISEFRIRCRRPRSAAAAVEAPRAPQAPRAAAPAARTTPPPQQPAPHAKAAAVLGAVAGPRSAPSPKHPPASKDARGRAPTAPPPDLPRPASAGPAVPSPARELPATPAPAPIIQEQPPPMIPAPDAAIDTAEAAPPETEPVEAVVLTSPAPAELVLPAPAELVLPAPAGPATPAVADSAPRPGRRGSSAPHFRILQCKRCGYYVKPTTLFCPACGKWRRLAYAVLAGVLLLLALLGVAAVLWLPRLKLGAAQARGASSHGAEARGYVRNTRAGGVTLYSLISRGGRSPAAGAVRPQVASTRGAAATAHAAGPLHDRPAAAPAALR